MAFEYTPLTAQNQQRQRDQYQPFQARVQPSAGGTASNPNAMQLAKAMKGLGATYNSIKGAGAAGSSIGGTGYGLGQSLQSGELGASTYAGSGAGAGSAVAGGTEAGSAAGSGVGSTFGSVMGGLNMAKDAYGIFQGMQTPQGVEGRDRGSFAGSAAAAGQGAAGGASVGGPIGAIVGAGLGNESYQWQHGNRKSLTSLGGLLKSELTGGLAARDIGSWTGLWE
ncbi:MAG: hypothetical protein ACN6OP_12300 [Pseudomonadales bacterium]